MHVIIFVLAPRERGSTVARLSWKPILVPVLWNGIDVWTPSSEPQTKGAMTVH